MIQNIKFLQNHESVAKYAHIKIAKISCNKVHLGMFFPVRFTVHRRFGDLEMFLSVLNSKIISAQPRLGDLTHRLLRIPVQKPASHSPKENWAELTFAKTSGAISRDREKILANSGHPSQFLKNLIGKIGCSSSKYRNFLPKCRLFIGKK